MVGRVNDKGIMTIVVLVVAMGIVGGACWVLRSVSVKSDVAEVRIGSTRVFARVADSPEEYTRGLSGTPSLGSYQGMLFVYQEPGIRRMWMKDMRYSLDMLWLDADKKVIHIEKDVSPDTYPKTFAASAPSQYVIELPSGFVEDHQIQKGFSVVFSR